MTNSNTYFSSNFAPLLQSFIDEKKSIGYKYETECRRLQHFDRYCVKIDQPAILDKVLVEGYLTPDANRSAKTTLNMIGILRQFAFYLQRNSHDAYVFPTELLPKKEHLYTPYIFTRNEIASFLKITEKINPNREFPKRHIVLPLLFRTLYCCGLRISEALDITINNIDFENGILILKNTKDYRDRLIPLSPDLQQRYLVYLRMLHSGSKGDSYFFQSDNGKQYSKVAVSTNFRNLLWKCGISYGGRKKGPHLHSLRHTFSVHCLQQAMARGQALNEFLPVLSAYLGHKTIQGTQKYLHMTAELFQTSFQNLKNNAVASSQRQVILMNKSEEFALLVSKFLADYLLVQKNLSGNTIISYRNTFMLLLTFMKQVKAVPPEKMQFSNLDSKCIQDFLLWLETERNCSISTRNQRLAAIHSFVKYTMFVKPEMLYDCQQILGISYKKVPQATINYLTEDETKLLLAQPDTSTPKGIRDSAMLSLLYDSAARIQEFIDINVKDLRLIQPATLTLTGKGRKTRQVPIMKGTFQLLEQYMSMNSLVYSQSSGHPLFVSHTGNRFTRPGITHVLSKYCLQAFQPGGFAFTVTPHILRHSKGMHMLHAGINIYYIKEFLGHSDLSTTERYYVRADTEMKRKALSKMAEDIIPMSSGEKPGWKKDTNLLNWLKSLS